PIIGLEEPAVWSVLELLAPGRALDAACGTGRHARFLVERGHDVVGVDYTPEMLARSKLALRP
ncbi:MAG: class I SAM-dependent methyltransferase, partial [Acidimicrobiales bacterium]